VASKTSTTRKAARSFDVLLPRLTRAAEGVTFEAGNHVRRQGTIPAQLAAIRLSGSPLGAHAAPKGGDTSLCGCPLTPNGKGKAEVLAQGTAARVATAVTCKFCQARLVAAGVLAPEQANEYARDYGTRDAGAELARLEAKAGE
jgi:hypothetical protein